MLEGKKTIELSPELSLWLKVLIIALLITWGVKMIYDYKNLPGNYPREITVSASDTQSFKPDLAVIDAGMKLENKDAVKIVKENNDKLNAVIGELKKLGVEEDDISMSDYSLSSSYTNNDKGERIFQGYVLSNQLKIKVRNLEQVGQILTKINERGVNVVNSVNYQLTDPEQAKTEVIKGAIAKAQDKANAVARESGLQLTKVVGYFEDVQPFYGDAAAYGVGGADGKTGPVANQPVGNLEMTVKVNLNYQVR